MSDRVSAFGGARLTEAEILLARASIDLGDRGAEAWGRWLQSHRIEDLDSRTGPAAPFLHDALSRSWPEAPGLRRLRGACRHHWTRQKLTGTAFAVVAPLAADGVSIVLHREAALALTGWHPPGLRPLRELDLLVPEDQLERVDRTLRAAGWECPRPLPSHRLLPFIDGMSYRSAGQVGVRLVWHPFGPADTDEVRRSVQGRAEIVDLAGTVVRRPRRGDLLMMTAQAAASGACSPLLALLDAHRLTEGVPVGEWRVVIDESAHDDSVLIAARQLAGELARVAPTPAPEALIRALDERLGGAAEGRHPHVAPEPHGSVADHWRRYRAISDARRLRRGVAGFGPYLVEAHRWYWGTSIATTIARGIGRWASPSARPGTGDQPVPAAR